MCTFAKAQAVPIKYKPFIERASGIYALSDPPDWAEDDSDVAQHELKEAKLAGSFKITADTKLRVYTPGHAC